MAVQDRDFVTARGLAQTMEEVSGGGVQFVELYNGNSSSVTLPQPFGMYKVLFGRRPQQQWLRLRRLCAPGQQGAILRQTSITRR